jgi:CheY-like chemotaxis protein
MNDRKLVLVVEDSEEDFELLKIAIRKGKVSTRIEWVKDGQEAIDYLRGSGKYGNREAYPFPGMLFLDIKLPKLNGFDVLKWLKEHEECKVIPVMVLTSSAMENDVMRAYQLGTNCYMVKPNTLDTLVEMVDLSFRFWGMCALPLLPDKC